MHLTHLINEDYVNYKFPSLFLSTSRCTHNCPGCQNNHLKCARIIESENSFLIARYLNNPLTKAIVIGGLDPFDTFDDTRAFYKQLRRWVKDSVVIYTGYSEEEVIEEVNDLIKIGGHLIIKYGVYIAGHEPHYDEVLGINLASDNQYAKEYNI